MKNEVEKIEDQFSAKHKNDDPDDAAQTVPLMPLIIKQSPKYTKGTKSLPYEFGAETYNVYSNLKNPFMVGILSANTERIQLDPIKTQTLFHFPFYRRISNFLWFHQYTMRQQRMKFS